MVTQSRFQGSSCLRFKQFWKPKERGYCKPYGINIFKHKLTIVVVALKACNPLKSTLVMNSSIIGIIPARFQSSRFPGKPLEKILGVSLIQRTYENAKRASILSDVIVATDDTRILNHVLSFGGKATLTSPDCLTGSDRIAEVALTLPEASIIVNIQGDEPCLDPLAIEKAVKALQDDPDSVVSTAATKISFEEAQAPSVVKCVFNNQGRALYFSRSVIPGSKVPDSEMTYYRHLGLYVYRRDFLLLYPELKPTPLMLSEDLEQLKILEHGYNIQIVTLERDSPGVDIPEDIQKVEKYLCQQNTSS